MNAQQQQELLEKFSNFFKFCITNLNDDAIEEMNTKLRTRTGQTLDQLNPMVGFAMFLGFVKQAFLERNRLAETCVRYAETPESATEAETAALFGEVKESLGGALAGAGAPGEYVGLVARALDVKSVQIMQKFLRYVALFVMMTK